MNSRILYSMLVIAALVLTGVVIAQHLVVSYEDKRKSPLSDVLNNPMAALEQILIQSGKQATSFKDRQPIYQLPNTDHSIVVRNLMEPLTVDREDALLDWVEQGGTLIYEPYWLGLSSERPYLHERIGILIIENEDYDYGSDIHASFQYGNDIGVVHQTPQYYLTPKGSPKEAPEDIRTDVKNIKPILKSEEHTHGYEVRIGEGKVFLLSDTRFLDTPTVWGYNSVIVSDEEKPNDNKTLNLFRTTSIAGHDHLAFTMNLIGDKTHVWLLYDTDAPSFISIMYHRFPLMVITLGVWVLVYISYLMTRFGPVNHTMPTQQRNILQHLNQAGLFLWKLNNNQAQVTKWQSQIINRLKLKHPRLSGLEEHHFHEAVAGLAGMNTKDVAWSLNHKTKNRKEFVKQVGLLKILWNL